MERHELRDTKQIHGKMLNLPSPEEIDAASSKETLLTVEDVRIKWRRKQVANLEDMLSKLNSSWRCRQISMVQQASPDFSKSPDICDLDPSILACFGNMNSEQVASKSKHQLCIETDCGSKRTFQSEGHLHPPRMSGFLSKRSQSLSPHRLLRGWQERWFIVTPHRSGALLEYYKKDSYESPAKSIIISTAFRGRRESAHDTPDRFGFSFVQHGSSRRVVLAASNEAQATAWISCVDAILDESCMFSRAASR